MRPSQAATRPPSRTKPHSAPPRPAWLAPPRQTAPQLDGHRPPGHSSSVPAKPYRAIRDRLVMARLAIALSVEPNRDRPDKPDPAAPCSPATAEANQVSACRTTPCPSERALTGLPRPIRPNPTLPNLVGPRPHYLDIQARPKPQPDAQPLPANPWHYETHQSMTARPGLVWPCRAQPEPTRPTRPRRGAPCLDQT